jgi:hypothetical protein
MEMSLEQILVENKDLVLMRQKSISKPSLTCDIYEAYVLLVFNTPTPFHRNDIIHTLHSYLINTPLYYLVGR